MQNSLGKFRVDDEDCGDANLHVARGDPREGDLCLGCVGLRCVPGRDCEPELDESILANPFALAFHIGGNHHPAYPPTLSPDGKDFLDKCFVIDPAGRATCEDLLSHPFVAASATEGVEEIDTYLKMRDTSVLATLNRQMAMYAGTGGLSDGARPMTLVDQPGDGEQV